MLVTAFQTYSIVTFALMSSLIWGRCAVRSCRGSSALFSSPYFSSSQFEKDINAHDYDENGPVPVKRKNGDAVIARPYPPAHDHEQDSEPHATSHDCLPFCVQCLVTVCIQRNTIINPVSSNVHCRVHF
jgi:hypothetical protein